MSNAMADRVTEALDILLSLGMPRAQLNRRSALCLLALLDLTPKKSWNEASNRLIGITPIMDWIREHYKINYAPNTRETIRRQSMHQFIEAGIALYNPDDPSRPVNSPKTVYQIQSDLLELLRIHGNKGWNKQLSKYLVNRETLIERYAKARELRRVPIRIADGKEISLSPGEHSNLIRSIIEDFGSQFVPDGLLVYVGDTGDKWGYFDKDLFSKLGLAVDSHGKMPDVVMYHPENDWLVLIEAVTSHGPLDGKRHAELTALFSPAKAGLVFVTAFPDRGTMARYINDIAWETEVWAADSPSHLIHFNGERFLGPY